jgi:hypothetical protein
VNGWRTAAGQQPEEPSTMNKCFTSAILFLSLSLGVAAPARAQQGPAPALPELKPLERWAGKWNTAVVIKVNGGALDDIRLQGTVTTEWIHNGYFLQQKYTWVGNGKFRTIEGTVLMTYDLSRRAFRRWVFASNGHMAESEGVWEPKSRTMTWTHHDKKTGVLIVHTTTFTDADTEVWTEVTRNREERILGEHGGTNTRQRQ